MPAARYVTLGDYLRVLRRFSILIVLLGAVGAAAGYFDAARQTARYEATAEILFADPVQDLSIVGLGSNSFQSPSELAAVNADSISAPSLTEAVKISLGYFQADLLAASSIGATVSPANETLDVTATSTQPQFAARYANAVANVLVAQDNAQVKKQFAGVVAEIQRRVNTLTERAGPNPTGGVTSQLSFYEDELARLQTVASFVSTANLSHRAIAPSSPFSPNKKRSLFLGLILGLLLGVLVAFIRDVTDRRLRSNKDLTEDLPFPIVGRLRDRSLGRIINVSGATDKNGWADVEAFRILRRNLEALPAADAGHTIVLITSAVPEEGKTTVASSLALAMALAGKKTLLVDCDLRRPSIAARFEIESRPGLTQYLAGEVTPAEILRTIPLSASFGGANGVPEPQPGSSGRTEAPRELVCIPAGATRRDAPELLGSERFRSFVDEIRLAYDVVIFDSSPLLPVSDTLEIIPQADVILMCVRHSRTTHDQAEAAGAAIGRFPSRPTGVVVTGLKPRDSESKLYEYSYDYS